MMLIYCDVDDVRTVDVINGLAATSSCGHERARQFCCQLPARSTICRSLAKVRWRMRSLALVASANWSTCLWEERRVLVTSTSASADSEAAPEAASPEAASPASPKVGLGSLSWSRAVSLHLCCSLISPLPCRVAAPSSSSSSESSSSFSSSASSASSSLGSPGGGGRPRAGGGRTFRTSS